MTKVKIGEKIIRTINFTIKDIDEEDRSFTAIASDDSMDRHGENISQDGWDLENFTKNPVVPWGHDYFSPPVGKATEIGVQDGKLMFKPKFATADEYPFADTIFKLYKGGYLRAFSVGFIPKEMDGDTFTRQELLEISAVTVPSNPNALALAYKEGVISDTERKSMVEGMTKQIDLLTKATALKDNEPQEGSNMEQEIKDILEKLTSIDERLDGVVEAQKGIIESIKSAEESSGDDDETTNEDPADEPEEGKGANSEETADSDENSDDATGDETDEATELSDEEGEKMLTDLVAQELEKATGKVK